MHFKTAAILLGFIVPFVLTLSCEAATYQWTDDGGGVHFTDNPDNVPAKYLKRVKEIDAVKDETASPPAPAAPQKRYSPPPSRPVELELFGGHDEYYWRTSFAEIRSQIGMLENGLKSKKESLNQLRRKKIMFKRHSDKNAYNELARDIEQNEAAIKELQEKLKALDDEAAQAGVPSEWRQ